MSRRFSTVLIANRGEIACRVIRSAKAEGYRTVAVYSDADANSLHVQSADVAVRLGPPAVGKSYLDGERVLAAAKETGADAIHPGYGFLSENGDFAQACAEAGITFIGPPSTAIGLMGNKAEAKRRMIEADVPCVPGYEGESQEDNTLKAEAEKIGFPILLKATAGGGGRGMRRVDASSEFGDALAGARSEARKAFGSDELIIEKLIENARHVEIQLMADEHGTCLYLGERDCSVQRRHQKVIEEAPCPVMTPKLRKDMGEAAVKAAQAAGYVNAGTVEFLLDADNHFYFLEMNTRLQVEHPVTELVTGLDLVALQLSVAQGEALALAQDDIHLNGHAIEARLYAEDPENDFAPQTGRVITWEPADGEGVRVDHGLQSGDTITPFYDAMVAKVIAWGNTRAEACARLSAAIENSTLLGVRTNAELLRRIVQHEVFASGSATTAFIETTDVLQTEAGSPDAMHLLIAAAILIERDAQPVAPSLKGWRSTGDTTVPLKVAWKDRIFELSIAMDGTHYSVAHEDTTYALRVETCDAGIVAFQNGDVHSTARYALSDNDLYLNFDGRVDHLRDITYAPPAEDDAQGDGVVKAPMVGQIVRVNVKSGDEVTKGNLLVVLEAMKMENQVVAPCDGTVELLNVSVGDQVDANQILLSIASSDKGE